MDAAKLARSITDEEIGLIKAMLARGERNVDIQFFFNRPERPVNSGRISQIRNGTYGPRVPTATQEELDRFLADFGEHHAGNTANIALAPTIADRALERFEQRDDGNWYLRDGETSQQECKVEFDPRRMNPVIRAIAALANNKGGFVFLGVQDADCQVVGLANDSFTETDIVRFSDKVKTFLVPTPDFIKETINIGGMNVGVLYVEKYGVPPVIVARAGDGLEDGSILFRYPGQSAKIRFGDLHEMLRERDRASQTILLKTTQRLSDIGPERSLIVDTGAATIETSDTQLMIDKKLADQLEFIRQGDFQEVRGAPTLRLVGDVKAVDSEGATHERIEGRALTADHVLMSFLTSENVRTPLDYVTVAAQVQRQWLPIFYFSHLSGMTLPEVTEALRATDAVYVLSKSNALERLAGQRSAFTAAQGKAAEILEQILGGDINGVDQIANDRAVARAIQALPEGFNSFAPILNLLLKLLDIAGTDSARKGGVFKAAARVDELAYRALAESDD